MAISLSLQEFKAYLYVYCSVAWGNTSKGQSEIEVLGTICTQVPFVEGLPSQHAEAIAGFLPDRCVAWLRPGLLLRRHPDIGDHVDLERMFEDSGKVVSRTHQFARDPTCRRLWRESGLLIRTRIRGTKRTYFDAIRQREVPRTLWATAAARIRYLAECGSPLPLPSRYPFYGYLIFAGHTGVVWFGLTDDLDDASKTQRQRYRLLTDVGRVASSLELSFSEKTETNALTMLLDEEDVPAGTRAQAAVAWLAEYYGPACASNGLRRYALRVGTSEFDTTVYTRPSYLTAIYEATDQCATLQGSFSLEVPESIRRVASATLRNTGTSRGDWDDPLYALTDLQQDGRQLAFSSSTYWQWRSTWGALTDELESVLSLPKAASGPPSLPIRDALLPDLGTVTPFGRRFCAGGVVVLLATRVEDGYLLLFQRRSRKTTASQKLRTTVPMGFHQPAIDAYAEVQPFYSALRELYEELFEGKEAARTNARSMWDWYLYEDPAMNFLWTHKDCWDLTVTGFGFNVLNGNYEFSMLLRVHNRSFWEVYGPRSRPNWEILGLHRIHLPRDRQRLLHLLSLHDWTPEARFHVGQSLFHLQQVEPDLIHLPELSSLLRS